MIQAICWVLIHSLWQGLLFTIATGLVMLATGKRSAALRYRWLCVLFGLFLAVCGGTFIYEWRSSHAAASMAGELLLTDRSGLLQGWLRVMSRYFSENASVIVMGWFLVFLIKCGRMTGNLIYAQRIRHYGTVAAPIHWQQWMQQWCEQLGIRKKVMLLQSRILKMPMVTGYWRPVVFMPLGLMTQLPAGEIEAILLHELAHIRRHDWIVNFLQHITENIFFFNPALLWMSALLRTEREHCCDDLAIAGIDGDKIQFVQALVHFKEYDLKMRGLATAWLKSRNQLVGRVMRIAGEGNKPLNGGEKIFFLVSMMAIVLLTLAMGRSDGQRVSSAGNGLKLQDGKMVHLAAAVKKETVAAVGSTTTVHHDAVRGKRVAIRSAHLPMRDISLQDIARPAAAIQPAQQIAMEADRASQATYISQGAHVSQTAHVSQVAHIDRLDRARLSDMPTIQSGMEIAQAERSKEQAERDRVQAEQDRAQSVKDRQQADRDRMQAELDRQQAIRDRWQADKYREQAVKDRAQAIKDREQAAKDRAQADRERARWWGNAQATQSKQQ